MAASNETGSKFEKDTSVAPNRFTADTNARIQTRTSKREPKPKLSPSYVYTGIHGKCQRDVRMNQTVLSPPLLNQDDINSEYQATETLNSMSQDLLSPMQDGSIMVINDTAPDASGNPGNDPHELDYRSPELYSQASQMSLSTPSRHPYQHGRRIMASASMLNLRRRLSSTTKDPPTPPFRHPSVSQVMKDLPPVNHEDTVRDLERQLLICKNELTKANIEKVELSQQVTCIQAELDVVNESLAKHQDNLLLAQREFKQQSKTVRELEAQLKDLDLKRKNEVVYFRGFQDPLSAFFPCTLKPTEGVGADLSFKSAEHLYHYRRLIAHDKVQVARDVRKAKTAAKAKSISESAVPHQMTSNRWLAVAKSEMSDVTRVKAMQSQEFRSVLIRTGTASLVHNMESDERWGFGKNGQGENWMGKVLEEVRDWVSSNPDLFVDAQIPVLSASAPPSNSSSKSQVVILSDSMLTGVDKFFNKDTMELTCKAVGGASFKTLVNHLHSTINGPFPDVVVVHCGTNAATNDSYSEVKEGLNLLLKEIEWYAPKMVILSGVIHRLDNVHLNGKVDAINKLLKAKENESLVFVEHNATFKQLRSILSKDGLHMKDSGKKQVASNIELVIRTGNGNQLEPRNWATEKIQRPNSEHTPRQVLQRKPGGRTRNLSSRNKRSHDGMQGGHHKDRRPPKGKGHADNRYSRPARKTRYLTPDRSGSPSPLPNLVQPHQRTRRHRSPQRENRQDLRSPPAQGYGPPQRTRNHPMENPHDLWTPPYQMYRHPARHMTPANPDPHSVPWSPVQYFPPWLMMNPRYHSVSPWGMM